MFHSLILILTGVITTKIDTLNTKWNYILLFPFSRFKLKLSNMSFLPVSAASLFRRGV